MRLQAGAACDAGEDEPPSLLLVLAPQLGQRCFHPLHRLLDELRHQPRRDGLDRHQQDGLGRPA